MRILQIISSSGMYGAEAVILNLSRFLNAGPHCSKLVYFQTPRIQITSFMKGPSRKASSRI